MKIYTKHSHKERYAPPQREDSKNLKKRKKNKEKRKERKPLSSSMNREEERRSWIVEEGDEAGERGDKRRWKGQVMRMVGKYIFSSIFMQRPLLMVF